MNSKRRSCLFILLGASIALGAFIVLFYAVENYRGARALDEAKRLYSKKVGELDPLKLASPKPPDDENFASADIVASALDSIYPQKLPSPILQRDYQPTPGCYYPQAFPVEYCPLDTPTKQAAEDILELLKSYETDLSALRVAANRPKCWYPEAQKLVYTRKVLHLPLIRDTAAKLSLKAVAQIDLGDGAGACSTIIDALKVTDKLDEGYAVLCLSIELALKSDILSLVWYGLNKEVWDQRELEELCVAINQTATEKGDLEYALKWECLMMLGVFEDYRERRLKAALEHEFLPEFVEFRYLNYLINWCCPSGWYDQNQAAYLISQFDTKMADKLNSYSVSNPYHEVASILCLGTDGFIRSYQGYRRLVNLALYACKMEEVKLTSGSYLVETRGVKVAHKMDSFTDRPIIFHVEDGKYKGRLPDVALDLNFRGKNYVWRYWQ